MSATTWTKCPRCTDLHQKAVALSKTKLDDSYGNVPLAQYQGAAQAHQTMLELSPQSTWREDYEVVGASAGQIEVNYFGSCDVCKLECSFTHTHSIAGVSS